MFHLCVPAPKEEQKEKHILEFSMPFLLESTAADICYVGKGK